MDESIRKQIIAAINLSYTNGKDAAVDAIEQLIREAGSERD